MLIISIVLSVLNSCNEPNFIENQTIDVSKEDNIILEKTSEQVKPVGKIIGYKEIEENVKKRKVPIYYDPTDTNIIEPKALPCDYFSQTIYELDRYQSKSGKWLGIWTNFKTKSDLYHRYGFNQLFVSSYQDKQQAIAAGFKVDSLMGEINFSPSSVDQFGYLKYYHLDEPIERFDAYPEEIRLIGNYIHSVHPNSIMMMASYRSPGSLKWYNPPLGRIASYKTLYKNETMDLASNIRIMCDYYHNAFGNPTDQRSTWTEFKDNYGIKNISNWINLKEDSPQFGDNQFQQLLQHAQNKGINNIWIYGLYNGYGYLVDSFCEAAFYQGWLRKFVKKYKYMYHCPEYYGDPCYCNENDGGWQLAWIQYLGIEELHL